MKYFSKCKTLDQVKDLYRQLAMENHPDRGGDTATMQAINVEYKYATALILQGANLSADDTNRQIKFSEEYQRVVSQIIKLPDITIELIGMWIWVSGNTKPVKKQLADAGLHYAPQKKVWFYRSEVLKPLRGSKQPMNKIRAKYGSKVIAGKPFNSIETEKAS